MNIFTPLKLERDCIIVIGKESTGKSQLIASLTGQSAYSANFRGSTTITLDPLLRPFGLSGRDLVRVIMGFGCNVPAVISTRACSSCSRGTCISAIAFGSACSYQFAATLGVFSAAELPYLVIPYLLYLTTTTLIYTRIIVGQVSGEKPKQLLINFCSMRFQSF